MLRTRFFGWMLALAAFIALPAIAAEPAGAEKAFDFARLQGIDGKEHRLSDMKDAKVVVVCFTCNGCPVAMAYEDRFNAFAKKYRSQGVEFIAVSTSDAVADLKARSSEKGFAFLSASDPTGAAAKSFGAKVTPHLFVLDADRKLAYAGAFDDDMNDTKASRHYVVAAVESLLAGKKPEITSTKPVGCGIKLKN